MSRYGERVVPSGSTSVSASRPLTTPSRGEPRPHESRRSQSRNYKGTPRFTRDDTRPPPAAGDERAPFARGKPTFGAGDKPAGFKKKYVGKAAGAKGSYKGGKSFRKDR